MPDKNDLPIRTRGNPSYGVTLHYNADRTKVSARSHFPYLWVNSDQLHVDKTQYRDASPISEEFVEYFGAMQCTIDAIDNQIAELTKARGALAAHMETSMMTMTVTHDVQEG
jgi:hypothetical protein